MKTMEVVHANTLKPRLARLEVMSAVLAAALAGAGCGDDDQTGPIDAGTDPTTDANGDSDVAEDTGVFADTSGDHDGRDGDLGLDVADDGDASLVPTIAEALTCGRPGVAGGLSRGDDLQRHDVDLDIFPDAVCNDGTGAVFYFRPYQGEANRNRWVVQLQGGGGCRTPDGCARRWCSVDTNFGMTQMTAELAPEGGINGHGILARRADNPLGRANHVFVRYCSSDSWSGTARNVVVTAADPAGGEAIEMRLSFMGSRIVDAVIDTLRRDGVEPLTYTLGGSSIEMPDLDDAAWVLFAGASAGGGGVANNADRVAERLFANNTACDAAGCPLEYRVLIDSSFGPSFEVLDLDGTPACAEQDPCDYETFARIAQAGPDTMWGRLNEASCMAFHEPTDDQWFCADTGHLMRHHITSPMFVRMGQTDALISGNYMEAGYGYQGDPLDLPTFAALVRSDLEALADLPDTAEEGDEVTVAPGFFGPTCSKHETLRSSPDTFDVTIRVDGTDYAMFDVLTNWVTSAEPAGVVAQRRSDNVCP